YFNNTVDFDPGAGTANLVSNGFQDAFLAKFDNNGNYIWAHSFGGIFFEDASVLDLDANGNIFVGGFFEDDVDFDPGVGNTNRISEGGYDAFISKFDNNGNFLWVNNYGSFSNDVVEDLRVDDSGNIFMTGYFEATVDFDPGAGTLNLNSAGLEDIFLTQIDNNGNLIWANRLGGFDSDKATALALDQNNQVVIGGTFLDVVDFDPGAGTANLSNMSGLEDFFFAKYTATGALVWAKSAGGVSIDEISGINIDAQNNIFLTGNFLSTADFDPSLNVANLTSAGSFDMFFAKYDPNGNYKWAYRMGGFNFDRELNICLDQQGNIYSTGFFNSNMDLIPGTGSQLEFSAGLGDLFVSKLNAEAEMALFGNGQEIANGDLIPAISDDSDYGRVAINTVKTQTFTIKNTGFTGLSLESSAPNYVSISGDAEFSIQQQPSDSLIAEGDSIHFIISFSPTLPGLKTATVSILNSDSDESTYTFLVQGMGSNIGPGGVSDSLKVWLRADLGVTESLGVVSRWDDQSIQNYDLANSNHVSYVSNQFNFNPSLYFDAEDDLIYSSADLEAQSVFIFQQMDNFLAQSNATFFSYFGADQGYFGRRAALTSNYDFPGDASNWYTSNPRRNGKAITGTESIQLGEADLLFGESSSGVRNTKLAIGGSFDARTPQGYVPEVAVYNDPLSSLEKQQVETYFALKYGLRLDQSTGQDYVASDGTVIWDYSNMGTFTHDVIGIGRDDLSAWSQKQSRGYNTDDIFSMALGNFATDNLTNVSSFSRDRTYLLCSNNDGSTLYANRISTQLLNASTESRLERVWRVEENMGDIGAVHLRFDLSSSGFPGTSAQDFALLVSDNPTDFSNATLHLANQYNSGIVDFQAINLADGEYFTVAQWVGQNPSTVNGKMLEFDGTGDYVSIPDNSSFDFGSGALTVEMWFKKVNAGRTELFSWRNNAGDEFSIFVDTDNTLKVYVKTDLTSGYQPIFGS
ncbi:MAG: choice-of-anchor D domain-containing protein, partial [Bacteroidota bacterium]